MDLLETKSEASSSGESQEENENELPEETAVEIVRPEYKPSELGQLVCYVRDMVVLYDLRDCDWNQECLTMIEKWFTDNKPVLFIYYSTDNVLTASLSIPLAPFLEATYFIRQPNEIFQVDTFHDSIQYGTIQDPDESLLVLMESIYAPYFFHHTLDWSDRVRVNFLNALDSFLIDITDLHYKISGLTILPVPILPKELNVEDEFTLRRLENLIIHWMGQIRTFLSDDQSKDLLCPSDDYDFWVYRGEVLHGLILQYDQFEMKQVLQILESKQSIYLKQFNELVHDCLQELIRSSDNMKYLALLIAPCKQLEECKLPSDIPALLPGVIRTIFYIQRHSKFLTEPETIARIFRSLTNHIILYCRSKINISKILLQGYPIDGIQLCSMSIDCCFAYRDIFEELKKDDSSQIDLDEAVIFNPIDTFIERLKDMILICEYSVINSMPTPTFAWGKEFEVTCSEMSRIFNDAMLEIKENRDMALDVSDDRWPTQVMRKFKETLKELDEIFQNMIKMAFLYCRNIDDHVEILCTLINYSKRASLVQCFNDYVQKLYEYILKEVSMIKSFILDQRVLKRKYALCQKYSGFGFFLHANLKRIKRLKFIALNLTWLNLEPPENLQLELETLERITQRDIHNNFEEWKASIQDNMIVCLQRSLLVRSLARPGLLECNIDRELVILLSEATSFKRLSFAIPMIITQLYQKSGQISFILESVITMSIDYNLIITSLTDKERLLFRPLIKMCDKKITAGIYKLNWAGELGDNYTAECLLLTAQIQEFMFNYKMTNKRIVELCEQICNQEIMHLNTKELDVIKAIEDQLRATKRGGAESLVTIFVEIVDQILVVNEGFRIYGSVDGQQPPGPSDGRDEWSEYVKKIDKLLENALCHCCQANLQTILLQIRGRGSPFVKVQVLLNNRQLTFHPEIATISSFFCNLFPELLNTFKLFKRLQTHLGISKPSAGVESFFEVLKANDKCREYQRLILREIRDTESAIAGYASTWQPFRSQWLIEDKAECMDAFDATDPSPENFHCNITKYTEIANQISMQNDELYSIHYVQLNVSELKRSVITHIDTWQRLHMDLLARRSFKKLDSIYEYIQQMSLKIGILPTDRQSMIDALALQEEIQSEMPVVEERFKDVRNHFRLMDNHGIEGPLEYEKKLKNLDGEWEKFLEKFKDAAEMLQTSKDQFN